MSVEGVKSEVGANGRKHVAIARRFTKGDSYVLFKWGERAVEVGKFKARVEAPDHWSDNAVAITAQKYMRVVGGKRETSVRQVVERIAGTLARWCVVQHLVSAADEATVRDELAFMLLDQRWAPNSPVFFNLGVVQRPQTSACFLLSVDDTMESILEHGQVEGMIFKGGSGAGVNVSPLRSSCEGLSGGGTSSGPLAFVRGWDAMAGAIKSGGTTRRAARMVVMNVDHPDVREFVRCKVAEEDKIAALRAAGHDGGIDDPNGFYQNANHSVRVSDAFMRAVEHGEDWQLRAVKTGEVLECVPARQLMREIAQAAWRCGDPGMQFDDTCNRWNTSPASGRLTTTNPCLTGKTRLRLADNRTFRIDDLAKSFEIQGKCPELLAWAQETRDWVPVRPKRVWKTKEVSELVDVYTHRLRVRCTPDHKFLLDNGSWIEAQDLEDKVELRSVGGRDWVHRVEHVATEHPVGVYDVEIPELHNFVVASESLNCGVVVHNCSEVSYHDNVACNLSSLNLLRFLDDAGTFDVDGFLHAVDLAILAQEAVVSMSSYPTDKIADVTERHRPLGLGYSNLGALLMAKGLAYDSDEGRAMAGAITALMSGEAYAQSARIASVVGPFAAFDQNRASMLSVIDMHRTAVQGDGYAHEIWSVAYDVWCEALRLGEAHGYRNGQVTVLAPAGTISFFMDCDTTGIEPDLALVKSKKLAGGGELRIANQQVARALRALGCGHTQIVSALDILQETGKLLLPDERLPVFDCALPDARGRSISWRGHVRMMAAVQPFLSGSISKTVNLPTEATVEDVENVYIEAWRLGLKAVAIYRDGSKGAQPLSVATLRSERIEPGQLSKDGHVQNTGGSPLFVERSTAQKQLDVANFLRELPKEPYRRRMPDERETLGHKFCIGGHEGYLHAGKYEDGTLGEIFLRMSKQGSTVQGFADAFATLFSVALQSGVPLAKLVEKFRHSKFEPAGFTGNPAIGRADSVLDYVVRYLDLKFGGTKVDGRPKDGAVDAAPTDKAGATKASADGPPCSDCGTIMRRAGSCWACPGCGATSGCS